MTGQRLGRRFDGARQYRLDLPPPGGDGAELVPHPRFPHLLVSPDARAWSYGASGRRGVPLPVAFTAKDGNGYRKSTAPGGKPIIYRARAVAETFLGPRPAGAVLRHLDGTRDNDAVSNLAYGTPVENFDDAVKHGTRRRVLTPRQVIGLLLTMRAGETDSVAARRLGVFSATVQQVREGRTYRHVAPCLPRRAAWRAMQAALSP